jgi:hypothetical protein
MDTQDKDQQANTKNKTRAKTKAANSQAKKKPVYTKPSETYYESGIEYGRNFAI